MGVFWWARRQTGLGLQGVPLRGDRSRGRIHGRETDHVIAALDMTALSIHASTRRIPRRELGRYRLWALADVEPTSSWNVSAGRRHAGEGHSSATPARDVSRPGKPQRSRILTAVRNPAPHNPAITQNAPPLNSA